MTQFPEPTFRYIRLEDEQYSISERKTAIVVIGRSESGSDMSAEERKGYMVGNLNDSGTYDLPFLSEHDRKQLKTRAQLVAMFDESFGKVWDIINEKKKCIAYFFEFPSGLMQPTLDMMELLDFECIYLHNVYFNELSSGKIDELHNFLEKKQEQGLITPVFIEATSTLTSEDHDLDYLSEKIRDVEMSGAGRFFSVVARQDDEGFCAVKYMALSTGLVPPDSPVAKKMEIKLSKQYSDIEISRFYEAGVVCFGEKYGSGIVCQNATMAVQTEMSMHKNIANLIIMKYALKKIKEMEEELVGYYTIEESAEVAVQMTESILARMKRIGMIRKYDVYVEYENVPDSVVTIEIEIVPIFSVERVRQFTKLRVRT